MLFCNFGCFQAILVHFVPFVKGVVPFLKGDGQLVKGADSLKLLSKLAVFPLLLITTNCSFVSLGTIPSRFPLEKSAAEVCKERAAAREAAQAAKEQAAEAARFASGEVPHRSKTA